MDTANPEDRERSSGWAPVPIAPSSRPLKKRSRALQFRIILPQCPDLLFSRRSSCWHPWFERNEWLPGLNSN